MVRIRFAPVKTSTDVCPGPVFGPIDEPVRKAGSLHPCSDGAVAPCIAEAHREADDRKGRRRKTDGETSREHDRFHWMFATVGVTMRSVRTR